MKTWSDIMQSLLEFYPVQSNYSDGRFLQILDWHNITERGVTTLENFKLLPHVPTQTSTNRRNIFNRVLMLTMSTLSPESLEGLMAHLVDGQDRFYEESQVTHTRMLEWFDREKSAN